MSSIEEMLLEAGCEGAAYFTDPDYKTAIIGTSHDGRCVYSYEKMVEYLLSDEGGGMSEEDARDWISYNTERTIPYMGERAPVIVYDVLM